MYTTFVQKFAKNGSVKPVNNTIKIKRERPPIIKTESELENTPFESSFVHCGTVKQIDSKEVQHDAEQASNLTAELEKVKNEKEKLIEELLATKSENQKIYFNYQSAQKMIATLQCERDELKEQVLEQNKLISQVTREKNACQTKIKQLMTNLHVEPVHETIVPDSTEEYEVEEILNHREKKGKRDFLIRWKNFSPSHDSWEKEGNLQNCAKILRRYFKEKGLK